MLIFKSVIGVYIIGSLLLGAIIGTIDYFSEQMILITIFLFVPNAILGYYRPSLAWLNGLGCLIGFIGIEMLLGAGMDLVPASWPYFSFLAAAITPIPAIIGSYWGAGMRWIYDAAKNSRQKQS